MNAISISKFLKAAFWLSLIAALAFPANAAMAFPSPAADHSASLAIAAHDDFDSALAVGTLPYRLTINAFEATEAPDDPPSVKCDLNPGISTVWYKYTPSSKVLVHMDTIGSNYDTYLAVWRGTRGHLTEVSCNDDANATTFASALNLTLAAGVTYYIEVAQFNGSLPDADEKSSKPVSDSGVEAGATHVFRLVRIATKTYTSDGANDGFVTEKTETSGTGYFTNSTNTTIKVGDDDKKRQLLAILSFNTATLPDTATVQLVYLKFKVSKLSSADLFTRFNGLFVDIRNPFFGTGIGLAGADFQAAASQSQVGKFGATAASGWYTARLKNGSHVNLQGSTQFRVRFFKDDNNDTIPDSIKFYSGNAAAADRPTLIVRYYIP